MRRSETPEHRDAVRASRAHYYSLLKEGKSPEQAAAIVNGHPVPKAGKPVKEPKGPAGPIEIPQNWADLPWPVRRKLAKDLAPDAQVSSSDDVAEVITAEIAARAKAAEDADTPSVGE